MDHPLSTRPGSHTETEVRERQSSHFFILFQWNMNDSKNTSYYRYMDDVPALLSHCFGKKRVSSELKMSLSKCVIIFPWLIYSTSSCVQVLLKRTWLQWWLCSTLRSRTTQHWRLDSVLLYCSWGGHWSSRSACRWEHKQGCTHEHGCVWSTEISVFISKSSDTFSASFREHAQKKYLIFFTTFSLTLTLIRFSIAELEPEVFEQ